MSLTLALMQCEALFSHRNGDVGNDKRLITPFMLAS